MLKRLISLSCIASLTVSLATAQTFKYIGADKCKLCHNKPATGEQYNKWTQDKHSKALASLSSPESLEYAKKNNIADPAKEQSCLKCHSTFHSVDAKLRATITETEGVSCESCHGPGSNYKTPAIMKNRDMAVKMGMIIPDKQLCLKCHNKENPFYKEFNYETALAKVSHPNPAAK